MAISEALSRTTVVENEFLNEYEGGGKYSIGDHGYCYSCGGDSPQDRLTYYHAVQLRLMEVLKQPISRGRLLLRISLGILSTILTVFKPIRVSLILADE
ncbi:hypothetical protein YC2023_049159 [Brassica napus]